MTLFHFALLSVVVLGLALGTAVGFHLGGYGGIEFGALSGAAVALALLLLSHWFIRRSRGAKSQLPPCASGRCAAEDYVAEVDDGHVVFVCRCGTRYRPSFDVNSRLVRLDRLLADGTVKPYMRRTGGF